MIEGFTKVHFYLKAPKKAVNLKQTNNFFIKHIISVLSTVQWNTYRYILNSVNTYIYSEIQHTYKHSYTWQPFRRRYNVCFFVVFFMRTHTHTCG